MTYERYIRTYVKIDKEKERNESELSTPIIFC